MKKYRITAMILALLMLCAVPAMASGLSGTLSGGGIEVTWQTSAGDCELTVYRGDWPVWSGRVNGGSGRTTIPVDDASADYRLRLKAPEGSYSAKVSGATQASKPTEAPAAKPAAVSAAQPVSVNNRDDLATQVLNLVNEERRSRGLGALRMDSGLTRAACVRAGEIAQSFSHTRPDGTSWSTVSSSAYGENIARGQQTPEKAIAAWMTSTSHRENILRKSYGSIGICAYKYNGVMYWVQLFGK